MKTRSHTKAGRDFTKKPPKEETHAIPLKIPIETYHAMEAYLVHHYGTANRRKQSLIIHVLEDFLRREKFLD